MRIHIAAPELVVLESENGEFTDSEKTQIIVRAVLEVKGFEQWSSIEIEEFTYDKNQMIFAKPVKILFPDFLEWFIN